MYMKEAYRLIQLMNMWPECSVNAAHLSRLGRLQRPFRSGGEKFRL